MQRVLEETIQNEFYDRKKSAYRSGETGFELDRFNDFCRGALVMAKIQGEDVDSLESTIEKFKAQLEIL
jgi:hypothetical protein